MALNGLYCTSFLASHTLNNTQSKNELKTETGVAVNLVKLKLNRKLQFFCKNEPKSFFANRTPNCQ